ncbi:DUF4148 domain-containing protein [Duganella sp. FT135W]|uniref:DUF4148 domain-containing protein n=1 Tax=Duganella flavida TaxID=2692175 RepID=A0A6L8KEN2_9BURK|nr:DUF4148 domain-containing protein [Duganella flavida]MYM25470.1 DUF4148 domain-containing protein [Duganella flavida]
MNTKAIIAAASLLIAAGSTFAADTNEAAFDQAFRNSGTSTLTREQVKAETIAARKAGLLDINDAYQDIAYQATQAKLSKQAEVKAQQLAAQQSKDSSTH